MRSYRPEELFDEHGRPRPEVTALAPAGEPGMGANPHANGGLLLRDLRLPDFRDFAVELAPSSRPGRMWQCRSVIPGLGSGPELTRLERARRARAAARAS